MGGGYGVHGGGISLYDGGGRGDVRCIDDLYERRNDINLDDRNTK